MINIVFSCRHVKSVCRHLFWQNHPHTHTRTHQMTIQNHNCWKHGQNMIDGINIRKKVSPIKTGLFSRSFFDWFHSHNVAKNQSKKNRKTATVWASHISGGIIFFSVFMQASNPNQKKLLNNHQLFWLLQYQIWKKICRHHKWMASMIYYSISDQTKMSIWMLIHFLLGLIIYLFVFFLSNQGGRRINFILCVSYPWLPFIWNIKNQMHAFIVSMISLDYLFSQYLVWLIVLLVNDWRKNPYLGWLFWFFSLHWLPPQSKVDLWNLNKKRVENFFSTPTRVDLMNNSRIECKFIPINCTVVFVICLIMK